MKQKECHDFCLIKLFSATIMGFTLPFVLLNDKDAVNKASLPLDGGSSFAMFVCMEILLMQLRVNCFDLYNHTVTLSRLTH